jgi:hypothetical protein
MYAVIILIFSRWPPLHQPLSQRELVGIRSARQRLNGYNKHTTSQMIMFQITSIYYIRVQLSNLIGGCGLKLLMRVGLVCLQQVEVGQSDLDFLV